MTHRRQNFMGGAAILALAVAVTKLLGALYKIPLGNLLDREGMAHFYAAYNIYSLLLVLSTAGLPVALSRMVARAAAQRRFGAARRCLRTGLALLGVMGLACSAVMCLLPDTLAAALHDGDAASALRALGPAVLLVCLSAALRGYTQGLGDMVPTAAGQVAESTGKLTVGLALCLYLLHRGAGAPLCAAGAIGGVTAGAGLGLLVTALLLPRRASLPPVRDVPPARRDIARQLLRDGVPITVGAAGMSLITLLDQTLVTGTLQNTLHYSAAETAALYGEYTFGMTLFALPPSFIYPLSVSLMPAVSAALTRGDRTAAGKAAGAAMKLTVLTALPAGVGLSVLALLCGGVLKVVTNYLMVGDPATGIRGAAVSTLYCYGLIVLIDLIAIARLVPERPGYIRLFARPVLVTAVMALAARSGYGLFCRVLPERWAVLPAIAVAAAVYGILALAVGAVTRTDVVTLPKGEKIADFLHLR